MTIGERRGRALVAYQAGDVEWHHEICSELERLEGR